MHHGCEPPLVSSCSHEAGQLVYVEEPLASFVEIQSIEVKGTRKDRLSRLYCPLAT